MVQAQHQATAADAPVFTLIWEAANRVYDRYFPSGRATSSPRTVGR